ncbi:MAG: SDR family oxidoreductase [Bdellovibrionales bacterium]|nr:SDR family oxidoreductase [Bdellovibrionales bacterium]
MNILITGTSRGIGLEFVRHYLKNPVVKKIFAVSTNADKLKSALGTFDAERLKLISLNVSDPASRTKLTEALAGTTLDLLINNAGVYPKESDDFEKITPEDLHLGFDVNVCSTIYTTQACLPALERSSQPKVISITSLMGSIADNTSGGSYSYRMSKTAINMFNKCFSRDYPKVTAVVLHPGWVKTEMGGADAPTTTEQSVSGMISVISRSNLKDSGKFFDFEGDEIPW